MKLSGISLFGATLLNLYAAWAAAQPAAPAAAPAWPGATARIVVPYPPGTEPDVLARDLGNLLTKPAGKTFVIENKPGANSILGTEAVAKSTEGGNMLLMVDRLAVVTNPMLYSKLPYAWEQELKPVSDLAAIKLFVAVGPNSPHNSLRDLIAFARANPGKVNVGTGGNGHVNHIGMEMLAQAEGVKFTYVPYKGVGPAMTGLMGGEVDTVMAGGLVMQQLSRGKKIKVVVVGDERRAAFLAEVPALVEAGGKPGSIPSTTFSVFAPGKTPDATVAQISKMIAGVMAAPEVRKNYGERGVEIVTSTPEAMVAQMKAETARYTKIIRDAGIRIE